MTKESWADDSGAGPDDDDSRAAAAALFKKKKKVAAVALRSATRVASRNRILPHLSMTGSILPWRVLA